jgi:hypothetical protein
MSGKTEIYTWRLSRALKAGLEEAARREGRTVAQLLDEIVAEKLEAMKSAPEEVDRQRRLHELAAGFAGCLSGNDPGRASNTRALVRSRLKRRTRSAP